MRAPPRGLPEAQAMLAMLMISPPRVPPCPSSLRNADEGGAVLLEVVLALVLFVAAAAIISTALNASLDGLERQKLRAHAGDLAVSVLSEIQMGLRQTDSTGPEPFATPFQRWTWQLAFTPVDDERGEASGLTQVEVVIRHEDPALVYRLAQVLKIRTAPPTGDLGSSPAL